MFASTVLKFLPLIGLAVADLNGWVYYTQNAASRMCAQVMPDASGNYNSGYNVDSWTCQLFDAQQWIISGVGTANGAIFENYHTGMYLTAPSGLNPNADPATDLDARVTYTSLVNGTPNLYQKWTITNVGGTSPYKTYTVKSAAYPAKTLDLRGAGTANDTAILTWSVNGGNNQEWIFLTPEDVPPFM